MSTWSASRKSHSPRLAFFIIAIHFPYFAAGLLNVSIPRDTYPTPVVVPTTGQWDGNDGSWSSFALQIGTPPQTVKVLASTAGTQTMVIAPEGCVPGDSSNCRKLRGEFFTYNESSTYSPLLVNLSSNIYALTLESELGYTGKGRYGFDHISFSWQSRDGIIVKNQTVAGVATKDFYMGLLGLTPNPSNFGSYNNPIPSLMENMRNMSLIPSISWAYTAGNQYRLNKVPGSLVLGGYDQSKFVPNNVTFPLGVSLDVTIQSITTNNSFSLLDSPIQSSIDSTIPYIYLPTSTCKLFENAFGLVWNETAKLYFLNDTQHNSLLTQNPSITFRLSPEDPASYIEISLPYSAFDLTASAPLVESPTRYFPLKRAENSTQHRIGRTFLQEAYIIADYERKNFSVSQCKWDPRLVSKIMPILPPGATVPTKDTNNKLSVAAIGGIAGGVVAVVLLIVGALLLYFYHLKPRRRRRREANAASSAINISSDFTKPELDAISTGLAELTDTKPEPLEIDGRKLNTVFEGDSQPLFELPAEEVASEMIASDSTPELDGQDQEKRSRGMFRRHERKVERTEKLTHIESAIIETR
ncbi:hypothetical protein HYFRA_00001360, partial [Hymenoscyphus fraxineus]